MNYPEARSQQDEEEDDDPEKGSGQQKSQHRRPVGIDRTRAHPSSVRIIASPV